MRPPKAAARREFDFVAAWSVDRLSRLLLDLLNFVGELEACGVDLYLHRDGLDTSTPMGKAMFQTRGVFAQFERAILIERTHAGLARARAEGKVLGGRKVPDDVESRVRAALAQGTGILKTAKLCGCGVSIVQRIKAELAVPDAA
jgi:DNA invertase Pin-like site-specific DNA recombinase